MQFDYRYLGTSAVDSALSSTAMSFVPDASREPTFFRGELAQSVAFREAISALHHVVVSDTRFQPRDTADYKEWRVREDRLEWISLMSQQQSVAARSHKLAAELTELEARAEQRRGGFHKARSRYFRWLFRANLSAWFVLDPVITVHPDQLFFECFSQDESSYGRLACNYEVFKNVGSFSCGTTNIDYSQSLYDEFQKIRGYRTTTLEVDPGGFSVATTGEEDFREVKIDLPDSWVRGFLQVSSAMTRQGYTFDLHPMDIHGICMVLRRHREKVGPRSMRYHLTPGEPVRITFDPWGHELICRRSLYTGERAAEIRVWGRRRIHQLERLIPLAKRFTVHLLGRGMPSFYIADLGPLSFTLGLSGWGSSDWSRAGNFDLLAPRMTVDTDTLKRVYDRLRDSWFARPDELARGLGLDRSVVLGALSSWTQAGRVMFDLEKGVYRARELSRLPLPVSQLRFSSPREAEASALVDAGAVKSCTATATPDGGLTIQGAVQKGSRTYIAQLRIDADDRLVDGTSTSGFFTHNRMLKGPCEIMLALRMHHARSTNPHL
jgi:hypothetical protein